MASRTLRLLCTAAILVVGPFAGVLVAIAIFIGIGLLVPGEPMYVGSSTPSLERALMLALAALATTVTLVYARHKLGARAPTG